MSPKRYPSVLTSCFCLACFWLNAAANDAVNDAADWTQWRGPNQNGIAQASGLVDDVTWSGGAGSNIRWKNPQAGGISTPVIFNERLYTIVRHQPGTPQDAEKVICLDANTGQQLWENVYNVFLSDVPAERIGWSNVACDPATGNVYALGACCLLQSMDGQTGQTFWSRSLSEEFGMLSTYGGRTNTPVVFEDLVIISGVTTGWDETARPAHRFLAFDKATGALAWVASTRPLPEDTTYSTPVFTIINGQDVMIAGAGDGFLYGMQPRTGNILWSAPISRRGINTSAVVDANGQVYTAHGEENPTGTAMGAVVRIDATRAGLAAASAEVWRTPELTVGKSSPLLVDGRLYVVEDSSHLHVLDAETGNEIGAGLKLGTSMRGSLIYADGKIYACTATGYFHLLKPTEDGIESVYKSRLPRGHEVGGSLAVSKGRLYLPTTEGLYCLAGEGAGDIVSDRNAIATAVDAHPGAVTTDATISHLQLIPAEAIAVPGVALPLRLVAYNAIGQRVETPANATFEVSGDGRVDADHNFVASTDVVGHTAAIVTARFGDHVATSRFRVVPPLPWQFEFSDNGVPVTWIGARYRHEPRKVDGDPVLVKITTIAKGTRSQSWMGSPDMRDYTVTADVKAGAASKLPDIGLIAQRYTLDLMGTNQQLQIRTWPAQNRMARSVSFAWRADTWYSIKFQATSEKGQPVLRGKVWPRGTLEPREWTLTATDPAPNLQGSPGLFGNATNAEIFIDNVGVAANRPAESERVDR
ncbi:outer membrane biogenesis protein BamB [Stieleria neptunia]|uniref:Outer membrane biogenesis protein BamB n=1 Tax=Stieleria neptunia TaxID=2527979 RepID=A0A518HPM9_9BACT|nr:PQQ-like beta-propeller repeat protein [Stieleria neptunia]QDV42798.1 outer membrane biogenesis protein BamB [Stieleria neptunia]